VAHRNVKLERRTDVEERRRSSGSTASPRARDSSGASERESERAKAREE
jgi:hypothetical protein